MALPDNVEAAEASQFSDATDFLHRLSWDELPGDVRAQAALALLDTLGVCAASQRTALSEIAAEHACRHFGRGAGGGARLLFAAGHRAGLRISPVGAAFAGASATDSLDAHDGHPVTKGHAGCAVVPSLCAFADDLGESGKDLSGREFLTALVVGYEIAIRAGMALHATVADYHTSGAWAGIGVAAMGARLMKLEHSATRHALGIAEYNGPRSQMMRCIDHPTMLKDGSGIGAMIGTQAAYLAADGFTGAPAITLESGEVAEFWQDLGNTWRLLEQYYKPYPVCRWAQPPLTEIAEIRRHHAFSVEDIDEVRIGTFHEAIRLAGARPQNTEEAQYSILFPVATYLAKGEILAGDVMEEALQDPQVAALEERISLEEKAEHNARFPRTRTCDVTLRLKDGRILTSANHATLGDAANPLGPDGLREKFRRMTGDALPPERAARLERAVEALADDGSLTEFLDLACGGPARADSG